jgi:hypothetical protein
VCFLILSGYALVSYLLCVWAYWLRRRTHAPRWASWLAYALVVGAVLSPVLVFVAIFGAISGRALAITVDADLSFVAEVLFPLVLAPLWLLVATWRWRWAARGTVVPRDSPYR